MIVLNQIYTLRLVISFLFKWVYIATSIYVFSLKKIISIWTLSLLQILFYIINLNVFLYDSDNIYSVLL